MGSVSGGKSSTSATSSTTIAPRSAQESRLANRLESVADVSAGGLGDLSALARGDLSALGASNADRALIEQSTNAGADIANRQIQQSVEALSRQTADRATGRGIEGSTIEAALEALAAQEGVRQSADVADQSQQFAAQAELSLPFQRAQTQLGANQQLFNQLVSASNPVLDIGLRERLGSATTQSESQTQDIGFSGSPISIPGIG